MQRIATNQNLIKVEVKQMQTVKRFTKADNGKLSKVIEYESGARVEIPINKDGSVKFFDDSKLLKKDGANNGR